MSTFDRVRAGVVDVLCVEQDRVKEAFLLCDDIRADSFDLVELVMWLEEEFNIEIPDEEITADTTVGDLVKIIDRVQAPRPGRRS